MTEQPALLHFAAEAHRRKWAFAEYDSAAFSVLDCIGNELRAAYDAAQSAAETPDAESSAPVPAERSAEAEGSAEAGLDEAAEHAIAADAEWARTHPGGPSWTRPPHAQVRRLIEAEWKRTDYWHKRWTAALERADAAGVQIISQHVRIAELEAKLAAIEALCRDARASAPESVRTPTVAVVRILAIIGSEGEAGNGC